MADVVSWDVAREVGARIAGAGPLAGSYHEPTLRRDLEEATAEAEDLVAEATGLRSLEGPARVVVTDRAGWVAANVGSFRRLLAPLADRYGDRLAAGPLAPVTRAVAGAQLGLLLGWMAGRVLGQYDVLAVEGAADPADAGVPGGGSPADADRGDVILYVAPNVLTIERRHGFPPAQLRLWLALHEVAHRAQLTGVPWMRAHHLSLVDRTLGGLDPDPRRLLDAIRRAADAVRAGRDPLADGGLPALLATPEQHAALMEVQGLMALLEGHADVAMGRAGGDRIPEADRFARVLHERRASTRGPAALLARLLGLQAKMEQYELGERFVEAVEEAGGRALFDEVWSGPDALPDLHEIRDPARWMERIGSRPAATPLR